MVRSPLFNRHLDPTVIVPNENSTMRHSLIPFILLVLTSCDRSDPSRDVEELISSANNVSEELVLQIDPTYFHGTSRLLRNGEQDDGPGSFARKLVAIGEYRFTVEDLDTARAGIQRMLKATGGHVQGDELSDWGDRMALVMRVRIPAEKFEAGVRSLHGLGKLEHQMMQVKDVGAEWIDVQARLKAKRVLEGRYLELVARSSKVSELLEVERELGKVRADIESLEASMRSFTDQVAMSTLAITCVRPVTGSGGFAANAAGAFHKGGDHFAGFLLGLLGFWPFVLVLVLTFLGMHVRRRYSGSWKGRQVRA